MYLVGSELWLDLDRLSFRFGWDKYFVVLDIMLDCIGLLVVLENWLGTRYGLIKHLVGFYILLGRWFCWIGLGWGFGCAGLVI